MPRERERDWANDVDVDDGPRVDAGRKRARTRARARRRSRDATRRDECARVATSASQNEARATLVGVGTLDLVFLN